MWNQFRFGRTGRSPELAEAHSLSGSKAHRVRTRGTVLAQNGVSHPPVKHSPSDDQTCTRSIQEVSINSLLQMICVLFQTTCWKLLVVDGSPFSPCPQHDGRRCRDCPRLPSVAHIARRGSESPGAARAAGAEDRGGGHPLGPRTQLPKSSKRGSKATGVQLAKRYRSLGQTDFEQGKELK